VNHLRFDRATPSNSKRDEVRIGPLVEDQEAGVDRVRHAVERHVDGIGVTARRPARLEQRHVVAL
jgi:hypothetical protein